MATAAGCGGLNGGTSNIAQTGGLVSAPNVSNNVVYGDINYCEEYLTSVLYFTLPVLADISSLVCTTHNLLHLQFLGLYLMYLCVCVSYLVCWVIKYEVNLKCSIVLFISLDSNNMMSQQPQLARSTCHNDEQVLNVLTDLSVWYRPAASTLIVLCSLNYLTPFLLPRLCPGVETE